MKLSTPTNTMSNIPTKFEVRGPDGTQHLPEVKSPEKIETEEAVTMQPEPPTDNISNG